MGFMSAPDPGTPPPPPPLPPAAIPASMADASVKGMGTIVKNLAGAAMGKGAGGTVATSPQGSLEPAQTAKATLLGGTV